ncbi:SDR family NAD(P)-dependent oxidoreductase [Rhodoplanes sp. TEM]|uniref:SDR family NAD(P)-dependent oxidoreductase n=1 Tax=Rhodoplanes tepidamans TaxID=200616 RepID=A0ABT5JIR3_RHOTP|nr:MULTISPECIES: SDR family NAD(P)-dependent oxidoreductase [Rhodoplanes]MDC7789246.1 SDR family NAD(P)-dependent oxidoreductase [Rhodoplanes tepidamans]MDC7985816.1 SDR family NAD(P)-dependent oxidoreductase [Rhodoplanes sp. TEM]MDQ0358858.1 short-subunit dehydrogenase [Rhodoplanes tepidamans]
MKTLTDKTIAITGAASGIGRALAVRLASECACVALLDRDPSGLADTAALCRAAGGAAVETLTVDVARRDAVAAAAQAMVDRFGGVDVLVNNAGVSSSGAIGQLTGETLRWTMEINFWGVVHGTMAFLPQLVRRNEASLVNVSSVYGLIGVPGQAAYCASKFAVRGFTEAVRQDLRGTGVAVSLVFPGGVRTNIVAGSRFDGAMSPAEQERLRTAFAASQHTSPEAAAEAILRGIRRKAPRILIGSDATAIDLLARLRPATYDSAVAKKAAAFRAQLARAEPPAGSGREAS